MPKKGIKTRTMPMEPKHLQAKYSQVFVGKMGVVVPPEIDLDTLSGLKLVEGKASVIEDLGFARTIAEKTGGTVYRFITEYKVRRFTEDGQEEVPEGEERSLDGLLGDIHAKHN